MPQIKIVSSPSNDSNSSELFLLEFQGKFETNGNVSLAGMEIGKLDLSGVKQPILQVIINLLLYFSSALGQTSLLCWKSKAHR